MIAISTGAPARAAIDGMGRGDPRASAVMRCSRRSAAPAPSTSASVSARSSPGQRAVPHHLAPADEDVAHVGLGAGEDQMRQRIEQRHAHAAACRSIRTMSANLPGSERADPVRRPERRRAVERHHPQRLAVETASARSVAAPVQGRGQPQRHPHVEVVARDRAVGAERHPDPGAPACRARGRCREASFRFDIGLCATVAPVRARIAISSSSSQTQCASTVRASSRPRWSRWRTTGAAVARRRRRPARPGSRRHGCENSAPCASASALAPPADCPGRRYRRRAARRPAARPRRRRTPRRTPRPRASRSSGASAVDARRIEEDAARSRRACPSARAAATVSLGCQNMSITVVTPPSSSSAKPSVAPSRTVSRVQDRALAPSTRSAARAPAADPRPARGTGCRRRGNGC